MTHSWENPYTYFIRILSYGIYNIDLLSNNQLI